MRGLQKKAGSVILNNKTKDLFRERAPLMFVSKIQLEKYKSIIDPVEIHFYPGLPTVLIGKNGSGKTNVLEALEAISSDTFLPHSLWRGKPFPYEATIDVSAEEIKKLFPGAIIQGEQIVAYNDEDDMRVSRIRSDYLVPRLKKEVEEVNAFGERLKKALACYEKQLFAVSHQETQELPVHCFSISRGDSVTNYNHLKNTIDWELQRVHDIVNGLLQYCSNKPNELCYQRKDSLSYLLNPRTSVSLFQLQFVKPELAPFEQAYVTIDERAIKRQIKKINQATKSACDQINQCISELNEREERLVRGMDTSPFTRVPKSEQQDYFLQKVQKSVGKKCFFLRNENRDLIFKNENRENYYYQTDRTTTILETFIRSSCQGEEQEELLSNLQNNRTLVLSSEKLAVFEEKLNQSLPEFENGMFNQVSVEQNSRGQIEIYLHEKTGERVALNETSTGRRWYFTYYFIKNTLEEGDLFLIDEPAGMLHPTAQKEVLAELMDLAKKGIQVVYSTHSPYLIPSEWRCVHFVSMGEKGTELSKTIYENELNEMIHEVVGKDVFFLQEIFEKYNRDESKAIARRCYAAIRKKWPSETLEEAEKELHVSQHTIISWQKGKKRPDLSNLLLVSKLTDTNILDLV